MASAVGLSRRPPPGSLIQPAAAAAAARRSRAPARGDAGSVAGPPPPGSGAQRREPRSPPRSGPPLRPRRQLRAPPARRRPQQHPRAGAWLGGAQLAGAHRRGSPARGRGRPARGAGGCAARLPPPGPRGGGAGRCSQGASHRCGRGAASFPRRPARPGAGFLRTGLLLSASPEECVLYLAVLLLFQDLMLDLWEVLKNGPNRANF
ncbi:uncharacterized protein FLJ37310-like [Oryctolagus cuniculus]|uniref:uncharacterized protein FLJ37310-like n=1 Tax=Oryctolagus cuniculus TaxID=9986 RepID=UPI0038794CD1